MLLSKLLENVKVLNVYSDAEIKGLTFLKDNIKEGDLFFCLNGSNTDGHRFAIEAAEKGAAAIICEREVHVNIPQVIVENSRMAMSLISCNFFDNPSKKLKIITVTGTNGKTSITYILDSIFSAADFKTGIIGTNGVKVNDRFFPPTLTTPDPIELNKMLNLMVEEKVETVFMEASAHAIYLNKLCGIKAEVGIFTNCTQDHLDYFKTMENYKSVKKSYFCKENMNYALVNIDDKLGVDIYKDCDAAVLTYGEFNPSDIFSINFEDTNKGIKFVINLFDDIFSIDCPLYGKFNMYNAMAAAGAAKILKIKNEFIIKGIKNLKSIDGRFNVVYNQKFKIIIDFAHTPDSMLNVLKTARTITKNRLICVFGCGGNRDSTKRRLMGQISSENADFTVVTSDNPRYEDPMEIICEIEKGLKKNCSSYVLIENRTKAIAYAIKTATEGDTVIICGKGAETYQDIAGVKYDYKDHDVVLNLIKEN